MAKSMAEIRREKLRNRTRQAVDTRDQKGLGRKSVLDWSRLVGKKPMAFEVQSGKNLNLIDFLPWVVTQEWYKDLRTFSGLTTNLDVGDWDYKLELPVHSNVGEGNDKFLCLRLAFGQKCPRCEEMFEEYEKKEPSDKKIQELKPSWRCWYNIYDYNEEENPDGVNSIWEDASYHLFEKEILSEADEGEETVLYSDIEMGKSVEIKGKEKQLGKNKFIEAGNVEFKDRDPYKESIVEETVSFDALVKICTYEEFNRAHLGLDDESENGKPEESKVDDPPEQSGRRSRRRSTPEKEESKDENPREDADGCPNGLAFGSPDLDSKECKNCPDDVFDACAAVGDQTEMDKKAEETATRDKEEETPPTRRRRRQR